MNPPSLRAAVALVLVESDDSFLATARAACALAFPGADATVVKNVAVAVERDPLANRTELLVLDAPSSSELSDASVALDVQGLPRWAIAIRGEAATDDAITAVAREDWNVRLVAKCFQAAAIQHRLRRELVRGRADFLTIGTRVAHDLRSPLGGILTTAEVLKEVLAEDAPARVPLTAGILESTEDLMKLIRQLSVLTKASAQIHPPSLLNMGEAFFTALQHVEKKAVAKGVVVAHPRTWPDVTGQLGWCEVIWQNLLANALEHAGAAPRVTAGWDAQGGEFRFWVRDNGSVALSKRATLFHPFHLLHHPNAPRGLGLSLVRRLVELQGGRCGYESLSEGGSSFYFSFPAAKTAR